jgi:hypothetical protein
MKVFAIHDAAGAISEIITMPKDGPKAGIVPRPGSLMTEIQVPTGIENLEGADGTIEDLANLAQHYNVIIEPRSAKLHRKAKSE